ncbi:MAG: M48 family metallopeptidase [Verrucomicrobiota bacterium]|nr:M48 family metallopeptidase [Verrucomicrobiota bacterium]
MSMYINLRHAISIVFFTLWVCGCYTVPQTGRSAFRLIPSDQLASMAAVQFGQIKKETPISKDPKYNAMVQRVGKRIAQVAMHDMPNAKWDFVVFDNDELINAFAMPGGKVAVYTGIFQAIKSDEDLAVVIGHEVAHVAAGHSNERVSQRLLAAGGALALQLGTGDMDSVDRRFLLAAYGAGATVGVILPYSRHHENEADQIGLFYAAKAGYDPRAAIGFWERMDALKEGLPPEFLSTHPSGGTRTRRLEQYMPEALRVYKNSYGASL